MARRPRKPRSRRPVGMRRDIARIAGSLDRGEIGRVEVDPNLGEEAQADSVNQVFGILTYFTKVGETDLFYTAQKWIDVNVTLRTAGPVAMGNKADLLPVLSGRGVLLVPDETVRFSMAKGDLLYFASETINRISIIVQEPAWQQGIAISIVRNTRSVIDGFKSLAHKLRGDYE